MRNLVASPTTQRKTGRSVYYFRVDTSVSDMWSLQKSHAKEAEIVRGISLSLTATKQFAMSEICKYNIWKGRRELVRNNDLYLENGEQTFVALS